MRLRGSPLPRVTTRAPDALRVLIADNASVEPQIRYATTSDGVHIAWSSSGSGVPFVWGSTPLGAGLADQWRIPELRGLFERIAQRSRLITFDPRGFGLSDRDAQDFSIAAMAQDLEAVVEAAELGPFILQTFSYTSVPALAFAAEHPERVRALILLNGVLRGSDMSDHWKRMVAIAEEDWEFATTLLARANEASFTSTVTLAQYEGQIGRNLSQDRFLAFNQAMAGWDASEVVSRVVTPSLVVDYGTSGGQTAPDSARRLATALSEGTYASVGVASEADRIEGVWGVALDFLSSVLVARGHRPPRERSSGAPSSRAGMAVILFTDIVDSTGLTERLGDAVFRDTSRRVARAIRAAISDAGGAPVEGTVLGDGVMGVFSTAAHAIAAARSCVDAASAAELQLHIGLHAGDVIHEDGNVYGGAVNIASRICGLCEPGEILVSATVRDLARTSAGVTFEDRGEHDVRGIADPVHVYAALAQPPNRDRAT
jgi:class 3 adenylate cyclase/pimeloyl-ACP methyl ester carboxylesterase